MAEIPDQKKEEKFNQPRKWKWLTYIVTFFFGGAAPVATYQTYSWYQEWKAVQPFYEVFATKGEAALVAKGVEDLKNYTQAQHVAQMAAITELRKESVDMVRDLRKYLDERRAARDLEILRLESNITQNKIDIANLKFITGKTN